MAGIVLSSLYLLTYIIPIMIMVPILQISKLRHEELSKLQDYTQLGNGNSGMTFKSRHQAMLPLSVKKRLACKLILHTWLPILYSVPLSGLTSKHQGPLLCPLRLQKTEMPLSYFQVNSRCCCSHPQNCFPISAMFFNQHSPTF